MSAHSARRLIRRMKIDSRRVASDLRRMSTFTHVCACLHKATTKNKQKHASFFRRCLRIFDSVYTMFTHFFLMRKQTICLIFRIIIVCIPLFRLNYLLINIVYYRYTLRLHMFTLFGNIMHMRTHARLCAHMLGNNPANCVNICKRVNRHPNL